MPVTLQIMVYLTLCIAKTLPDVTNHWLQCSSSESAWPQTESLLQGRTVASHYSQTSEESNAALRST